MRAKQAREILKNCVFNHTLLVNSENMNNCSVKKWGGAQTHLYIPSFESGGALLNNNCVIFIAETGHRLDVCHGRFHLYLLTRAVRHANKARITK